MNDTIFFVFFLLTYHMQVCKKKHFKRFLNLHASRFGRQKQHSKAINAAILLSLLQYFK